MFFRFLICFLLVSSGFTIYDQHNNLVDSKDQKVNRTSKESKEFNLLASYFQNQPENYDNLNENGNFGVGLILFFVFTFLLLFFCVFLYLYCFIHVEKLYISQRMAQMAEAEEQAKQTSSLKHSSIIKEGDYSQNVNYLIDSTENVRDLKPFKSEFTTVSAINYRSKRPTPLAPIGKVGFKADSETDTSVQS